MTDPFTNNFIRLLHENARMTTPDRLLQEGRRSLRVLSLGRIEELVGQAILRSLQRYSTDPEETGRMARGAQVEFLRLLTEQYDLQKVTERLRAEQRALQSNLGQLERHLHASRAELEREVGRANEEVRAQLEDEGLPALNALLGRTMKAVQRGGDPLPAFLELREALQDFISGLVLKASNRARRSQSRSRVDLLERRIAKLNQALLDANQVLEQFRAEQVRPEDGVASVYKEVQGLSGREPDFERRRALMEEVFKLNLELRHTLSESTDA